MSKFIHQKSEEISFSTSGADGFAFPIKNKKVEIDFIDCKTGHGRKVISDTLTHVYYILEGSAEFEIDDKFYHVSSGELVEIPPKHSFDYVGKMKALLIMEPPHSPEEVREAS
jgi:mannose-6-phosphate isomerase-like protein (cupin superfamily)